MGTDIPIWIGGLQKWVTGVSKHTTCEDVIKAVLSSNDEKHPKSKPRDSKHYTLVERWHKMERPLDPRSRLYKVWNTWGVEQCNVRFLLKKSHHSHTQTTPKDVKAHRRKLRDGKGSNYNKTTKTWHPKKLRSESEDDHLDFEELIPATTDELKSLITAQEDAIESQMRSLQEKDNEIEFFENQIHLQRMHQIGVNYVQDTYLAESSEPESWSSSSNHNSSGQDTANSQASCDILDTCIELYEKVLQICDKVHQEEHHIKELTTKLKETLSFKDSSETLGKKPGVSIECDDPELSYAGPERLGEMLRRTKYDIERLLQISETQQKTIQQNEQTLSDCTKIIEDKHFYLQHLKADLDRLDKDNSRLQDAFSSIQTISVDTTSTCDLQENGDSNSDTGLSSLHSSSDEGVPVLNTLV